MTGNTISFQLGGIPQQMSVTGFSIALGLHTEVEVLSPHFEGFQRAFMQSRSLNNELTEFWTTIGNGVFSSSNPFDSYIRAPMIRLL